MKIANLTRFAEPNRIFANAGREAPKQLLAADESAHWFDEKHRTFVGAEAPTP